MRPPASRQGAAGPVFVVAAPASGAALLACALAQHPRVVAAYDDEWLADLCSVVGRAPARSGRRDVECIARERYGDATMLLLNHEGVDGEARWVNGSSRLCDHLEALAELFPAARFIHVVRDADMAVLALSASARGADAATGGTQIASVLRNDLSPRDAYASWMGAVRAAVAGGQAIESERFLTVRHKDLMHRPESLLHECLSFVGESYAKECLRPLRGVRDRMLTDHDLVLLRELEDDPTTIEARALTLELTGEPSAAAGAAVEAASTSESPQPGEGSRGATDAAVTPDGWRDEPPSRGRIVMVTEHFPKFSETFFVDKFLQLSARGWDVHVVCTRSDPAQLAFFPEIAGLAQSGDRVHVTGDVDAQLIALEPDVVHFEFGTLARGRMYLRDLCGCAVVVSFRGYDINYIGLEDEEWYSEVWAEADLLHLVSEDVWARAQRRGCPSDKPHAVIRDATDTNEFKREPSSRERQAITERPLRVLAVGRLHWKKGYEYALEAVALLGERGVAVDYRIVGEGDHRDAILFAIDDLELTDRVELLGAQQRNEVKQSMQWADVLLHAAVSEGFCVSVTEAQAMGLPVVCTDADGLSENVADGESGFVVPRRDPRALADRLERLAKDPDLAAAMGVCAEARARSQLDARRQVDDFDLMYADLIKRTAEAQGAKPITVGASPRQALAPDAVQLGPRGGLGLPASERRATTLKLLEAHCARLEAQLNGLRSTIAVRQSVDRTVNVLAETLPAGARILVVSKGDDDLLEIPGRNAFHFPQDPSGAYAGYHPADSTQAITELTALSEAGAEFLVFPSSSQWWLEHYVGLRQHLESTGSKIVDGDSCTLYDLRSGSSMVGHDRSKCEFSAEG